jgi:tripartite-type tricarboxylate transporter receptor subunit TctC
MGQWLSERLGQPFVVENRPGAGGNIATEAVVRAPADGYTLILVFTSHAINATLFDKLNFNFIRDIAPVASIMSQMNLVLVNPSIPVKTIPELIAYARANAGKLTMASSGNGTISHVSGELFKMMAGVDLVHIPYRGGASAVTELIAGRVQVLFTGPAVSIEYVRAGKLRALAVTSKNRWDVLPELPTVGEFVPGYEASAFFGLGTPRNTPAQIVDRLNREINAGLADPKIKARLIDVGGAVFAGSPTNFGELIAAETEKWAKVIKFAGIKVE